MTHDTPEGKRGQERAARSRRAFTRVLGLCVILLALALLTFQFVLVPYRIRGDSMLPTLRGGGSGADLVLVSRLAYLWSEPQRWDVVVVERAGLDGSPPAVTVKRVVGLPGERIEILGGAVRVDGVRLAPPVHLRDVFVVSKGPFGVEPVDLGAEEYFLLGDNSYLSQDSRALGPVLRREISGRVEFRFFPLERAGLLR